MKKILLLTAILLIAASNLFAQNIIDPKPLVLNFKDCNGAIINMRTGIEKYATDNQNLICHAVPNPAANETDIYYQVPGSSDADVSIELYGVLGNQIMQVFKGSSSAGLNHVKLNAKDLANSAYFVKVTVGRNTASFPVVIMK